MKLTWKDSNQPHSEEFDDIYYAEEDGLEESRYVFLGKNELPERFTGIERKFTVAELGFGTGLNFLATWDLWRKSNKGERAWLDFISCEKFLLSKEQLAQALSRWTEINPLSERLVRDYGKPENDVIEISFDEDRVSLKILVGNALDCLRKQSFASDAWFFDGFAPRKNPDMWSHDIFTEVTRLSAPSVTFSTYTSAGFIRRDLQSLGFHVEKFQGFGRKRDMLRGRK